MATTNCIFGKILKKVREENNLSRAQLARDAHTDPLSVKKIEGGIREPRVHLAMRLARASGMELGEFFRLVDQAVENEKADSLKEMNK